MTGIRKTQNYEIEIYCENILYTRKLVDHTDSHLSVYVALSFISEGSSLPGLSGIFRTAKMDQRRHYDAGSEFTRTVATNYKGTSLLCARLRRRCAAVRYIFDPSKSSCTTSRDITVARQRLHGRRAATEGV